MRQIEQHGTVALVSNYYDKEVFVYFKKACHPPWGEMKTLNQLTLTTPTKEKISKTAIGNLSFSVKISITIGGVSLNNVTDADS